MNQKHSEWILKRKDLGGTTPKARAQSPPKRSDWTRAFSALTHGLAAALTLALLFGGSLALAANYTVTSTADSGPGSLRQVIADAIADPAPPRSPAPPRPGCAPRKPVPSSA